MEATKATKAPSRKHPRQEASKGGGHYADPMSPIASTPMKRPRTKPANTKSAKAKHGTLTVEPPRSAAQQEEEIRFFSPRKLAKEYDEDDGDDTTKKAAGKSKATKTSGSQSDFNKKMEDAATPPSAPGTPSRADHDDGGHGSGTDGAMFSPALKLPRSSRSRSPSVGNSPASDAPARLDKAFAGAESSGASTPVKRHEDKRDHVDDENSNVHCEESSIVSEEADDATSDVAVETEFNPFVFIKSLPNYEDIVPNGRAIVLPAKSKNAPKICLVLDLDETLVHCTVEPTEKKHLQFPVNFNGVDYTVNVRKRPHMEYFLKHVAKKFEVVVFTASHRAYAEKLLNLLDPRRELIKYRLYREDCLDVYGNYLKDLTVLGRELSEVVLVDNSPHAFGFQVNNGIPIETWYEDEADDELLNLLPFLESLIESDDVRPIVEKQFQIQKLIDSLPDEPL